MDTPGVSFDPDRNAWVVQQGDLRVYCSTEEEAWIQSGLPRPPGRYPITTQDWE